MTRNQRPRGSITRDDVVNAALTIADREGVSGLTIRSVAKLVGAPPMSLYSHFSSKEDLLDMMYAGLAARLYEDDGNPTWQAELLALCRRVRGLLLAHPRWAPLLSRPAPPLAVPMRERVLKLMVADGLREDDAFRALSSAVLTSIGLALMEDALRRPDGASAVQQRFDDLKDWYASQPDQTNSVTRSALSKVGPRVLDETFEFTVSSLVGGFEASQSGRRTTKRASKGASKPGVR